MPAQTDGFIDAAVDATSPATVALLATAIPVPAAVEDVDKRVSSLHARRVA